MCAIIAGVILSPQRPQNREFSGSGAVHRGHGYVAEGSLAFTGLKVPPPQRPQNLTPSAKRELQLMHATIPGITLDAPPELPALLPCDDSGWLGVP